MPPWYAYRMSERIINRNPWGLWVPLSEAPSMRGWMGRGPRRSRERGWGWGAGIVFEVWSGQLLCSLITRGKGGGEREGKIERRGGTLEEGRKGGGGT